MTIRLGMAQIPLQGIRHGLLSIDTGLRYDVDVLDLALKNVCRNACVPIDWVFRRDRWPFRYSQLLYLRIDNIIPQDRGLYLCNLYGRYHGTWNDDSARAVGELHGRTYFRHEY